MLLILHIYTLNNYFDLILQRTIFKLGIHLPISLPIGDTAAELEAYQNSYADQVSYMLTKANAGKDILFYWKVRLISKHVPYK